MYVNKACDPRAATSLSRARNCIFATVSGQSSRFTCLTPKGLPIRKVTMMRGSESGGGGLNTNGAVG